jgi:hypothetical protein
MHSPLYQYRAEMTAELCGGMEIALRLYLRGRSLRHVTETRRLHSVSQQQCWGSGNYMWYTPYAA